MPHKINVANSTISSKGSDGVVVVPDVRGTNAAPRKNSNAPVVVVHNQGGQLYDETRPSDWDKQRWK